MSLRVYNTNIVSWELYEDVVHLPYQFTRVDVPPTESNPELDDRGLYWTHQLYNYCPIDDPNYYQAAGLAGSEHPMYLDIMTYLEATIPNYPKRENLYSSYINVLRAHDCPGIHCDAPYFVEDNQTVIVYLNHHWDPQWGGETIFFDEDLDAVRLVQPRPGRVVIFDGRIPHTGRPPAPKFAHNRYIMTFKYMDKAKRHKLFVDHEINNMPPVEDRGIAGLNVETVKQIWKSMDTRS